MSVLVCGGAGYIGSHAVYSLIEKGEKVIVADDLSKGHRDSLVKGGNLYEIDLKNKEQTMNLFKENPDIDTVMHFCAYSLVGESVTKPIEYFDNNVGATVNLLLAMKEYGVKNFVFSSTAATYGEPQSIPILENDPTIPTNPYGESKLAVEKLLKWADAADQIRYTVLRYFNACGAHPGGDIGEDHRPESHLIPIILQVALGQRESIKIFGEDYLTDDGSAVRDYIHVMDLIDAHLLAVEKLRNGSESNTFNLGNGNGFSVKQVIDIARKVTGKEIKAETAPRRAGDPAKLVATSDKARDILGWNPQYADLEKIIEDAWRWHQGHPDGYQD